jgi:hypothetical protein
MALWLRSPTHMEIGCCLPCNVQEASCIGEGPEYKPFRDLRSTLKAGRQVRELKMQKKHPGTA